MSKQEKLIKRFKSKPKDFSFDELIILMRYFGYYLDNKGRTSGSRVQFISIRGNKPIKIHKPHNRKYLINYQMEDILKALLEEKLL